MLVNYACHPVVLGPRNRKISSDYPGVMRSVIEEQYGDDCTCIFIQGAGGDVNPLFLARGDDRDKDFGVVEAMGRMLAAEVKRALSFIDDEGESGEVSFASVQETFAKRFASEERMELGVTTVLINEQIAIVTLPGEPFHKLQVSFRERAGVEHTFFFGYCGNGPYGWARYLPDLVSAARGGYGASDTTVAEVGAGERLVNVGLVQLFQLQGRLKSEPQRHTFEESPE